MGMILHRLDTTSLSLRPFSIEDAKAVFEYWQSDPGWARYNLSVPTDFGLSDAEDFVAEICARDRDTSPSWAILYRNSVVGVVSFVFGLNRETATIGYGIHGELRGRGYSVEASKIVIDQAFAEVPELITVFAHTNDENLPSMRVLKKLGFSRLAATPKNQLIEGSSISGAAFALTREHWMT